MQNHLITQSKFYKEALLGISTLDTIKGISDVKKWDKEHLFYNKLLFGRNEKTFSLTKYCERNKIYIFDQLLDENVKQQRQQPFDKILTSFLEKILLHTGVRKEDILIMNDGKEVKFVNVTHKQLYETAITTISRDHHSQVKWVLKLNSAIPWLDVWGSVHNFLSTNRTKSIIWQQIHLNFYTQYSYNKWHKVNEKCPLCQKIPQDIYHIILHCDVVNKIWEDINPTLMKLYPASICDEEKVFGIIIKKTSPGILLRNWITYLLRACVAQIEREAHCAPFDITNKIKRKVQHEVEQEVQHKLFRYTNENKLDLFDKIITHANVICEKQEDGKYTINHIFN